MTMQRIAPRKRRHKTTAATLKTHYLAADIAMALQTSSPALSSNPNRIQSNQPFLHPRPSQAKP